MSKGKIPDQPFQKIALSLSGGGYRAASFHLGSMSYLYKLKFKERPLLENVKILSTVSGGTITGVLYAIMVKDVYSFPEFYKRLYCLLNEYDLIEESLKRLKDPINWPSHKRKNLINAFALTYDEVYTEGKTFSEFDEKKLEKSHLDEVVFNATGFEKGLSFRFQNQGIMGNHDFRISHNAKPEVKLGDIIAASSCFPAAFEPIAFPDDFMYSGSNGLKELKDEPDSDFNQAMGLMDGGIYDNQGIDSILKSDDRRKERKMDHYYDLIIISDVGSPDMEDFKFAKEPEHQQWKDLNYKKIRNRVRLGYNIMIILNILLIVFSLILLVQANGEYNWQAGAGISIFILAFIALGVLGLAKDVVLEYGKNLIKKIFHFIDPEAFFLTRLGQLDFSQYTIKQLEPLFLDRIKSVFMMINDVFLKQIRRLNYNMVF